MNRKIRLIAFDLDGTLLTTDKRLTAYTRRVLKRAAGQGIWLLPATGRPITGIPEEILGLPGMEYLITANGARAIRARDGKTIWEKLVPVEKARNILDIFGEYDTLREIYYDGRGYADARALREIGRYIPDAAMAEYVLSTRVPVEDLWRKFEEENRGVDKVQALFANTDEKEEARGRLLEMGGAEVTGALAYNIEVNALGVDKGEALLAVAELLGVRREETLAFGDGANDVAMIRAAGIGAGMANGIPEVREAADVLAGSNDEDGVARVIEQYL